MSLAWGGRQRQRCSTEAGAAAAFAEREKAKKYSHLEHSYSFQLIAFETSGSIGPDSVSFLKDLGCCIRMATGEPQSFSFLMQRFSVTAQTGMVLGSLHCLIIVIIIFFSFCFLLSLSFLLSSSLLLFFNTR